MTLYHKIEGPFKRTEDLKRVDLEAWRNPVVELLAGSPVWVASEKIDGTNIRIEWDGHRVSFGGRTERADLPKPLVAKLEERFHRPGVEEYFEEVFGEKPVTLYGEGYGPKIQSGGKYRDDQDFIGFDVAVAGTYLSQENAESIFKRLEVPVAPVRTATTLLDLIQEVQSPNFKSWFGDFTPEGLVARTVEPLYDQRGNRVIVKLKVVDLVQ